MIGVTRQCKEPRRNRIPTCTLVLRPNTALTVLIIPCLMLMIPCACTVQMPGARNPSWPGQLEAILRLPAGAGSHLPPYGMGGRGRMPQLAPPNQEVEWYGASHRPVPPLSLMSSLTASNAATLSAAPAQQDPTKDLPSINASKAATDGNHLLIGYLSALYHHLMGLYTTPHLCRLPRTHTRTHILAIQAFAAATRQITRRENGREERQEGKQTQGIDRGFEWQRERGQRRGAWAATW
jgi:hypothetical protein